MSRNPVEQLQLLTGAHFVARCVHVAADIGVADALGEESMPVATLAKATGCDADALGRIVRVLSGYGVFTCQDGSVAHTDICGCCVRTTRRAFARWSGCSACR